MFGSFYNLPQSPSKSAKLGTYEPDHGVVLTLMYISAFLEMHPDVIVSIIRLQLYCILLVF